MLGCGHAGPVEPGGGGGKAPATATTTPEKAPALSDAALIGNVKKELDSTKGLDAKDIQVSADTSGKTIILTGTVPEETQKKQAEDAAAKAAGTEYKVTDSLTVKTPPAK